MDQKAGSCAWPSTSWPGSSKARRARTRWGVSALVLIFVIADG
ncbi:MULTISPECIES: hypothetical protein [unclassified Streptomyces]|nr:hypothetical protein [Streptomyces sp. NBC_01439]